MSRFVSSLVGILMIIVLALSAAGTPVSAQDVQQEKPLSTDNTTADKRIEELASKEVLSELEWEDIGSLSPELRETVLLERGWVKAVCPEDINSYADLIPEEVRAKMTEAELQTALRNCAGKEKIIPFSEFKAVERWVPPAEEVRLNGRYIGGWGGIGGAGDGNCCDFDQSITGDIVVTQGTGWFAGLGLHNHAAIVTHPSRQNADIFSVGPDAEHGVFYNSRDRLHLNYDAAELLRVDPCSSGTRAVAADFAESKLGLGYDDCFYHKEPVLDSQGNEIWYCSQLCWKSYDISGIDLDSNYFKIEVPLFPPSPWPTVTINFPGVAPDDIWASPYADCVTGSSEPYIELDFDAVPHADDPLTVDFTGYVVTPMDTVLRWDFGEPPITFNINPTTHTFTEAGWHTVTLSVKEEGDSDWRWSYTKDIYVRQPGNGMDVDGDGQDDVIGFHNNGVVVGLSNGSGFNPATYWRSGEWGYNQNWRVDLHVRL